MDAASDLTLRILMVCGIVTIVMAVSVGQNPKIEWVEGFCIFIAVIIVIAVTAGNDWMKEKQFRKLSAVKDDKDCTVIRDNKSHEIRTVDIVVGDVIYSETGDELPADCLVINQRELLVDESSLTGESDHVGKRSLQDCLTETVTKAGAVLEASDAKRHHVIHSPIVLSGTTVTGGSATLLVVAVGEHSQVGQMFAKLTFDTEPTPLQNKLNAIARDIGKIGLICALLTFAVLVVEFWIMWALTAPAERQGAADIGRDHMDFLVVAITILVVAIPEGLPLAVTISLAYSIGKMLKDQNYVRRLAACETMGGADEICSDKTGTLTKNRMTAQAFWNGSKLVFDIGQPIPGGGDGGVGKDCGEEKRKAPRLNGEFMEALVDGISINSTAYLETEQIECTGGKSSQLVKHVGSPTECALLQFIQDMGYSYEDRRRNKYNFAKVVHQESFSSARKMMSTVVKLGDEGSGKYRVFVKGGAERVLRLCTHRIDSGGSVMNLDAMQLETIEKTIIYQLASQALRTICIAYKDFDPSIQTDWLELADIASGIYRYETDLVCLGIAGIRDPVRDEVPSAVRACQQAGITVRMVTGDNLETAKQIAIKCNIYKPEGGGLAMLGPEFYKMIGGVVCEACRTEVCDCPSNEKEAKIGSRKVRVDVLGSPSSFENIANRLQVLARSQPNDKYALVTGLINRGAVVAVTGDGTNDAPALKKADVGFAMGLSGKEVAKQAADIVLLDDNFESIVKAVKWGRNIYDNIRRFLQFQLTVNLVAVSSTFISAVIFRESPLKTVQMLWVNLIMDSLGSLALATEPPTDELLNRPPHRRDDYLVSKLMFRNIVGQAIYQFAVVMIAIFAGDKIIPEKKWDYVTQQQRLDHPEFCEFSDCEGGPDAGTTIRSGRRFYSFSTESDYDHDWEVNIGPSRHFTFVFNMFVWLQIFNMINARKTNNEINMFEGLCRNRMWLLIWCIIICGQVLMVEFGSWPLDCHLQGLTAFQWFLCVAIGASSLLVSVVLRFIPLTILPETGQKEVNPLYEPPSIAMQSRGRMSSDRLSYRIGGGLGLSSEQKRQLAALGVVASDQSLSTTPRQMRRANTIAEVNTDKCLKDSPILL
eukprot:GHVQ01018104.1.p1 GENE.GHVQ01018104.1~~GHVQ01018104.1.p1  ORF type:complete len:1253 (+),score=188.78 GHVQ01018104.1:451-3759(+)